MGARPGRDPAGADRERAAPAGRAPGRRPDADGPRRRRRRAARRRRVRLLDRPPGRDRLHHDARLPPQHLPGRDRDPGPRAAGALPGQPRPRRQLPRRGGRGGPHDPRLARRRAPRRHHRPRRPARARSPTSRHPKASKLDLTPLLHMPDPPEISMDGPPLHRTRPSQDRRARGELRDPRGPAPGRPRDHARASRFGSRPRSATSTARSAASPRTSSRASTAPRACPTTPSSWPCAARSARAAARGSRPASRSTSPAR